MENCLTCKHWTKMESSNVHGHCHSPKINVHPNYYEDSDKVTESDMLEVTYQPVMGEFFGCVHHLINDKNSNKLKN